MSDAYKVKLNVSPGSTEEINLLIFLARFLPPEEWAKVRRKISGHVRSMPIRVLALSEAAQSRAVNQYRAKTVGELADIGRAKLLENNTVPGTTIDGIARRLHLFGARLAA